MNMQTFAKTLVAIRHQRQISQRDLIEMGFTPSHIHYLEKGKRIPRLDTLEQLCHALGISMVEFFTVAERIEQRERSYHSR